MPALYPAWTNTAFRIALVAIAVTPVVVIAGLLLYVRSPWNTRQFVRVDQPVEFDHRHHVADDGIDCLYCHSGAETSAFAGVPSTDLCMGCHSQVWNQSPLLETVRRSYFADRPIAWNRVHDVGDFAYFNHAVHTARGIGCVHCHGRVDQMARVEKVVSLNMGWCLDCHRDPEKVLSFNPRPSGDYGSLWGGQGLALQPLGVVDNPRAVTRLTTCTACHR